VSAAGAGAVTGTAVLARALLNPLNWFPGDVSPSSNSASSYLIECCRVHSSL
jgi:hypothetical protein